MRFKRYTVQSWIELQWNNCWFVQLSDSTPGWCGQWHPYRGHPPSAAPPVATGVITRCSTNHRILETTIPGLHGPKHPFQWVAWEKTGYETYSIFTLYLGTVIYHHLDLKSSLWLCKMASVRLYTLQSLLCRATTWLTQTSANGFQASPNTQRSNDINQHQNSCKTHISKDD